jgi:hypothetical protein
VDIAYFQVTYPEIVISCDRCNWSGNNLEYFNFSINSWEKLAEGGQCLQFVDSICSIDDVDSLIKSSLLREGINVGIVCDGDTIGVVRGDYLGIEGENDIHLQDMVDFNDLNLSSMDGGNFEAPDFFSLEEDIREIMERR